MTNLEFAQGLRELADLYERHPELLIGGTPLYLYLPWGPGLERIAQSVKAFADGGTVIKHTRDNDDYYYTLKRTFAGGLEVYLNIERSALCKKVTKMQMVETWECPDSILELGESNAEETA